MFVKAPTPSSRDPLLRRPAWSPAGLGLMWVLLGPLALWQGWQVRRRTPVLPEAAGSRLGIAGVGPVALRVLILGDSSAAGVGAATQDEALAGQLAAALVRQGFSAVAWQLVARTGHTVWTAREELASIEVRRADVLVTVFGVNESIERRSGANYVAGLDALVGQAQSRAGIRRAVHCAPPRMECMTALPAPLRQLLGAQAASLDRALKRHLRGHRRRTRFEIPFAPDHERAADWLAEDGFHPNARLYARWAEALAQHIDIDIHTVPESRAVRPSGFSSTFDLSTRRDTLT